MRIQWLILAAATLAPAAARADLRQLHHVDLSNSSYVEGTRHATDAARALTRGDYAGALAATDKGLRVSPHDPWLHYDRGMALTSLGRLDEGVAELNLAEQDMSPDDLWGRSVAIYGRAIKLQQAGRCTDANLAFNEYARLVGNADPNAAQLALAYGRTGCMVVQPVAAAPGVPRGQVQPVGGRTTNQMQQQRVRGTNRDKNCR